MSHDGKKTLAFTKVSVNIRKQPECRMCHKNEVETHVHKTWNEDTMDRNKINMDNSN